MRSAIGHLARWLAFHAGAAHGEDAAPAPATITLISTGDGAGPASSDA